MGRKVVGKKVEDITKERRKVLGRKNRNEVFRKKMKKVLLACPLSFIPLDYKEDNKKFVTSMYNAV